MPKRKASALDTRSAKTQQSICTFSRVTKPNATADGGKRRKTTYAREAAPPPAPVATPASKPSKRKREAVAEEWDDGIVLSTAHPSQAPQQSNVSATPRAKRVKNAAPPTPHETPSKKAAVLFDGLTIGGNARAVPIELAKQQLTYDTPPETPVDEVHIDLSFPQELEDLVDMHSAFLAALSLYYSHNGNSRPVEVVELVDMVTKHWKKRAVTQTDIQRILALGGNQDRPLMLEDCGRAGIRLSRSEPRGRGACSYINEDELNTQFEEALQKAWHTWQSSTATENRTASAFLAQLPLREITKHDAAAESRALFAKGEARLADIKAGKAAQLAWKKAAAAAPAPATASSTPAPCLQRRSTALLDRIRAKQALASSQPAGPTPAQRERHAALHRIEDVARILSLAAGAKDRSTLSMPAVVQLLQQSLRSPITAAEVARCLALMSTHITPAFVKVVQSGHVQAVVVTRAGSVELRELRDRVERACGGGAAAAAGA